jgi:hypothetical protein
VPTLSHDDKGESAKPSSPPDRVGKNAPTDRLGTNVPTTRVGVENFSPRAQRSDEEQPQRPSTIKVGSRDQSPESRVRQHLAARGYDGRVVRTVFDRYHDGVVHVEPWAETTARQVAEEFDKADRRWASVKDYTGTGRFDGRFANDLPPEKRDWRSALGVPKPGEQSP